MFTSQYMEKEDGEYPTVLVGSRQLPVSARCQKGQYDGQEAQTRHDLIRQVSLVGGGLGT